MFDSIRSTLNPAWYHGRGKAAPFFEGWYFKLVNAAEDQRIAIIPGVFIHQDPKQTHSFIQVLDGMTGKAHYHRFGSFLAAQNKFEVSVGQNKFSEQRIALNVHDEEGELRGEIRFGATQPWPVSLASPGIMGWYGWLPFMECYHGVLSFDHTLEGQLIINGQTIDFTGGRGYIEKDWGQSFPSGYIWMQSNHFDTLGTCLTASIAEIPSVGRKFAGFIVGLWHQNQLYKFTTYNASKTATLRVSDTIVEWSLYNKQYELQILATRNEGGLLKGPQRSDMHMRVDETMKSTLEVRLFALDGFRKRLLFEEHGRNACMEVVGDLSLLLRS